MKMGKQVTATFDQPVQLVTLIRVVWPRGRGVDGDPCRRVPAYYTGAGELLWEDDPGRDHFLRCDSARGPGLLADLRALISAVKGFGLAEDPDHLIAETRRIEAAWFADDPVGPTEDLAFADKKAHTGPDGDRKQ